MDTLDDLPPELDRDIMDALADANREAWERALDADPGAVYGRALSRRAA